MTRRDASSADSSPSCDATSKTREIAGSGDVLALGFLVLMVIASPLSYIHHLIFLYPGSLMAWRQMARAGVPRLLGGGVLLGLCLLASLNFPAWYGSGWVPVPLRSVNLFVLLVLLLLSLLGVRHLRLRSIATEPRTTSGGSSER